jgi:hypothetical protein
MLIRSRGHGASSVEAERSPCSRLKVRPQPMGAVPRLLRRGPERPVTTQAFGSHHWSNARESPSASHAISTADSASYTQRVVGGPDWAVIGHPLVETPLC